jgi:hypothetical protein
MLVRQMQCVFQRFAKTLPPSKPGLERLATDARERMPNFFSRFQHDRNNDHIARAAALTRTIAKPQQVQNASTIVATLVHAPMFAKIANTSNAFSESITGNRFMLLMDLEVVGPRGPGAGRPPVTEVKPFPS